MSKKNLDKLIEETVILLNEREADRDVILAVVSILKTEEHFEKMIDILKKTQRPGREFLIGKTVLIADGDI